MLAETSRRMNSLEDKRVSSSSCASDGLSTTMRATTSASSRSSKTMAMRRGVTFLSPRYVTIVNSASASATPTSAPTPMPGNDHGQAGSVITWVAANIPFPLFSPVSQKRGGPEASSFLLAIELVRQQIFQSQHEQQENHQIRKQFQRLVPLAFEQIMKLRAAIGRYNRAGAKQAFDFAGRHAGEIVLFRRQVDAEFCDHRIRGAGRRRIFQ